MPDDVTNPGNPPSDDDSPRRSPTPEDAETLDARDASTVADDGESPAKSDLTGEPSATSIPAEKPTVIGRYKLLKELGKGGFGIVWQAEQTEPIRREVALKIIKPGMDSREIIARFEAERQALALMDHPNIAAVLDAGTTDRGLPYFVMELVKGAPITEYCDAHKLGIRERLELFIPVCQAVQHAHQKAILHRDLKPSNILVTEVDGKPVPKVIDFGIAKALGASQEEMLPASLALTQAGMIVGTPQYMSPEQAGSVPDVDTRSDIYTLGVILYELLVGETPLSRGQLKKAAFDEVLRLVREGEPQRPSSRFIPATELARTTASLRHTEPKKLGHALRGDLDWIVLKALEKDRARRYDTANAFAQDLHRHLNDEPVSAGPPSARYRLRKLVRRNRLAFAAAACILVLFATGITVSTWQAVRASREAKRAHVAEHEATKAKQKAEAVSTFLIEVFKSPDPEIDGRTITVAENLDRAAKRLETDLANDPARRVDLQLTIGQTYNALGLDREAFPLFEKVRDYDLANLGPENTDTLDAISWLAICYSSVGRHDEALKMQVEMLALRHKVSGPEHPQTLSAMGELASSFQSVGREDEALKLREEVLALSRRVNGPEHRDTLTAMNNLALSYDHATGRQDEALKLEEEDLALSRKLFGLEHPETVTSMLNLASFLQGAGRRDEALKLRKEAVALRRKIFGPEHPATLYAMARLANSYATAGRQDEALKLREEVLTVYRKVPGPEHFDTLRAMGDLATSYGSVGRQDEALKLREEVLTLCRKVLGSENSETLRAMSRLANSYADAGRRSEALKMHEEVLTLSRNLFGPEDHETIQAMSDLAGSYRKAGRHDEALKLREEVLALRRKLLGPEHPNTLRSMSHLAGSYRDAGRHDEALNLREEVLALRRKVLNPDDPETFAAMNDLAKSYAAAGRLDEALPLWVESSARLPKDTSLPLRIAALQIWLGKDSDHAATCRRMLELAAETADPSTADRAAKAYCLKPSSDPQLLESALALARRAVDLGKDHPELQWYQMSLGMAEYRHGDYPAADQALRVVEETDKGDPLVQGTARLYHAMSLYRQNKEAEARKLFAEAEAQMKPLPADEPQPLANGADADSVIVWLAYKEAKALLNPKTDAAPAKP